MHAIDYVRLGCDIIQFWKCASPAVKKLYENKIFTRLSVGGKSMFADENMEKSVGHIRGDLGKVERSGMDKKMEASVARSRHKQTQSQTRNSFHNGTNSSDVKKSRSHEWLDNDSPLLFLHYLLHNKIWL